MNEKIKRKLSRNQQVIIKRKDLENLKKFRKCSKEIRPSNQTIKSDVESDVQLDHLIDEAREIFHCSPNRPEREDKSYQLMLKISSMKKSGENG